MQVEPLALVSDDSLRPVLEEEGRCWSAQLGWDFADAAELIRRCVAAGGLSGFALLGEGGDVLGYNYYVVDGLIGYLGNLFITRKHADVEAYGRLADRTVRAMRGRSGLRRIEGQLFPFNCELAPLFERLRFEARPREFLTRTLSGSDQEVVDCPGKFQLIPWEESHFLAAAEAVHDSYRGSPDLGLCDDYQSRAGCVRFLRNLIESPGCGSFLPEASVVALDRSGSVASVLVASRIGPRKAMVPQVSVRREHQGKGLGTLMLRRCFHAAAAAGYASVSLSVSERNSGARRLYRRLGFRDAKRFHAYVWNA